MYSKTFFAGWLTLRELFPELAAHVPDYKPEESPEVCKAKLEKIFSLGR